jgi:hypothetical protein
MKFSVIKYTVNCTALHMSEKFPLQFLLVFGGHPKILRLEEEIKTLVRAARNRISGKNTLERTVIFQKPRLSRVPMLLELFALKIY